MNTSLLQISDPHFGTERPAVVEALLAFAHDARPELVVLSGDITQRARAGQFATARRFVEQLPAPVLAIPGNHDIPLWNLFARFGHPYDGHRRAFGDDLEPTWNSEALRVLCVNTTRPHRHKHGEVSMPQMERVAAQLAAARPKQLRVVVVHQPVAALVESDRGNLLRGHDIAVQRWADAGADIVMGGHVHLPYVLPLHGAKRPLWAVQAGTAVSRRTRDGVPNSVNRLAWNGITCAVERWDHDGRAFALHSTTELKPLR